MIHKDFLNNAGVNRVMYARFVGTFDSDGPPNDTGGHGTLNAAIVGGYQHRHGVPFCQTAMVIDSGWAFTRL